MAHRPRVVGKDCPNGTQSNINEKFTFFYRSQSPFSQWHPSEFTGVPLFNDTTEYEFSNCEQWMMMNKACLFNDFESARKIMSTPDPRKVKALGRKVRNFDDKVWVQYNEKIIYDGNELKFTQNEHLWQQLQSTAWTTLVEASPTDKIYGIGLKECDPRAQDRKTWRGRNLLGEALTRLREDLIRVKADVSKDTAGPSP